MDLLGRLSGPQQSVELPGFDPQFTTDQGLVRLTTIQKAPFFACKIKVRFLVILSGLKINNRMQVLDKEKKVIPGLYAAGNVSGSFFGNHYPTTVPGLTHSRAWTFGRLAGLHAAAEKG